jgi:hypothetical protein
MFSEVCLKSVLLSLFFGSFRPFSPQKAFFVRNFVSTAVASLSGGGLRPGAGGGGGDSADTSCFGNKVQIP